MSVEHAHGTRARKHAVLLLGCLLTSGACAQRDVDARGAVGASRANGSGAVTAATDLASPITVRPFRGEERSRLLPVSNGPGSYSVAMPKPHSLALVGKGAAFVSAPDVNEVYALVDDDGDHRVDRVRVVTRGLDTLNWTPYRDGSSYNAEISRALGMDGGKARLDRSPKPVVVVTDKLPAGEHYGWRYVRFGADGWLYIPVRVTHEA